jgi:hypothetical protein
MYSLIKSVYFIAKQINIKPNQNNLFHNFVPQLDEF